MTIVISQKRAKPTVSGRNEANQDQDPPPNIGQRFRYTTLVCTSLLSHLWRALCGFVASVLRRRRVSATAMKSDAHMEKWDIGNQHLRIVGLDCEMVGVGCKGRINMLARCTLVLWDPHQGASTPSQTHPNIKVIYDKLVKPTRRVTDYRTEYSGITKEMLYEQQPSQPLVDFQTCRGEVRSLLSSIDGKNILLVGHALVNDFKVLHITHPSNLIRDTATYPPFLIKGHTSRRHRQQKLSFLARQELGMEIQQGTTSTSTDGSVRGHCPVEDASAALLLYLKHQWAWETHLGKPLLRYDPTYHLKVRPSNDSSQPSMSIFLDGCNLPISLQRTATDSWTDPISWKIISRTKIQKHNTEMIMEHDWIPTFRAWLSSSPTVPMDRFVVMFDGSKYKNSTKIGVGSTTMLAGEYINIELQITDANMSADDCLVDTCRNLHKRQNINTNITTSTSISDVLQLFSNYIDARNDDDNIREKYYVVVRRRGGCRNRQTKLLFQKLNLTRSNGREGVFCLTHLTQSLLMDSVRIAREIHRLNCSTLHFEIRNMNHVRMVVCTNDILLADRIVKEGGITLTYRQFQHLKTITV